MARTYEFHIGTAEAGLRLDHYLVHRLPAVLSRAMIQRAIRAGQVYVNGYPVKAHHKLRHGERISATFEQLPRRGTDTVLIPQEIPLEIVYEDAALLVVNKPAGLVTHPAPGHWDGTLVNAVVWHLGQRQATSDKRQVMPRAGIVHRLDKDTSGLLLIAKTETAHVALSKQLKSRTIHRRYLAIVEGHLPLDQGTITAPLGRHTAHRKVMAVRHLGGRSAVTHYRVLKRLLAQGSGLWATAPSPQPSAPSPEHSFSYSVVEVSLETGRTHQIRVHMAHLNHPVLGDATYGRHAPSFWQSLGITRHLLHAYQLNFRHPVTRQDMTLSAPIPEDLGQWCDAEALAQLTAHAHSHRGPLSLRKGER